MNEKHKDQAKELLLTHTPLTFAEAMSEYYSMPNNGAGGRLHLVLDDLNVRNSDLEFCEKLCLKEGDWLGLKIIEFLQMFPEQDRKRLIRGEPIY